MEIGARDLSRDLLLGALRVLVNPSLNPEEDVIGIFGVRARLVF